MSGKETFLLKLKGLVEIAQKNGNKITIQEVTDYFSEEVFPDALTEEQMELVFDYLLAQRVAVQGYVKMDAKEELELTEEEKAYLKEYLAELEGVDVSGGEAQKIAIARALYKDAPFIILDEPTAALDPIAEAEIYSKFNDIADDRTAIYISHRLSSCKFCDEIAVFHEGAVIEQGTHANLVADESGKYYELWHAQAQYYTA